MSNQSNPSLHPGYYARVIFFVALAAASLACQLNLGGPAAPGDTVPSTDELAESFTGEWETILQNVDETGKVMIIFTEAQLTSFLAQRLANQENSFIENPQVYLRDGTLQIYGTVTQLYMQTSILISIVPVINNDGELSFEIVSADLGPLPMPDGLRSSISSVLTEAFTGNIGPLATGVRIQSIAISNGELALVGTLR